MTTAGVAILVASLVAVDLLVIIALRMACAHTWSRLASGHQPVEPAPDAVRRRWQSFSVELFNLGFAFGAAADDTHLHLDPNPVGRLMGATSVSIPWEALAIERRRRRTIRARVNGVRLTGPAWCLALADPDAPGPTPYPGVNTTAH